MQRTRILPLAGVVLGSLALTGCIIGPPAAPPVAPQTTAPTTSAPTPSAPTTSEPAESEPAETSTSEPSPQTGSSVTIDGASVGEWGGTISCYAIGGTALISGSTEDGSNGLFGTASEETGAWVASAFLITMASDSYVQSDDAPATLEGGTFSTEFTASDFAGGSVQVAITAPC